MLLLSRLLALSTLIPVLVLTSGCTTTSLVLGAVGVATDTSVPWAIVKHLHAKMTEGDPVPCTQLNSVQRALSTRCGDFVAGSLDKKDIASSGLQECPLALAARDTRLWPVLPELLSKGASVEACWQSPLVEMAQASACPEFSRASPEALNAITWLAEADTRAVRHDVVRMLSCPGARVAGLDRVLQTWQAGGDLKPWNVGFSPLNALHPRYLDSPLALELEADGHTARAALGAYKGKLSSGFEEALRTGDLAALDWWLNRMPELVNKVPATQGNQVAWLPLARVLIPTFLEHPEGQREVVEYLLAHGADPYARLPYDPNQSVIGYARWLKSPQVSVLANPPTMTLAVRSATRATVTTPLPVVMQNAAVLTSTSRRATAQVE